VSTAPEARAAGTAPSFTLAVAAGRRVVLDPLGKLRARGNLPGAYGYDLGAHAVRVARARGVPLRALLACALPGSWMVNNRAPSPVFRRWLTPPLLDAWDALCALVHGGPEAWLALGASDRADVTALVGALCIDGHGVAAVSKVLAYLLPESVPLMDDAMLALAIGAVPEPATADDPRAGAEAFVPAMDWFSRAALEHEPALLAAARAYELAPLDAAQALDRLLWVESWGWRGRFGPGQPTFARVQADGLSAVLASDGRPPGSEPTPDALTPPERAQWEHALAAGAVG
jgi:hypothetical protein